MSKIQELPHRKDVKVEDTWDLTPIFKMILIGKKNSKPSATN